jgi:hypothetical protein
MQRGKELAGHFIEEGEAQKEKPKEKKIGLLPVRSCAHFFPVLRR